MTSPFHNDGTKCEEASTLSREHYIPCFKPVEVVVWHERDQRAYLMCAGCADHNIKNRGGKPLAVIDPLMIICRYCLRGILRNSAICPHCDKLQSHK